MRQLGAGEEELAVEFEEFEWEGEQDLPVGTLVFGIRLEAQEIFRIRWFNLLLALNYEIEYPCWRNVSLPFRSSRSRRRYHQPIILNGSGSNFGYCRDEGIYEYKDQDVYYHTTPVPSPPLTVATASDQKHPY